MKNYRPYLIFLITLIVFSILFFINHTSSKIRIPETNHLSTGWIFEDEEITLPRKVNALKGETIEIERVLDASFHEPQVLMLRTSLQNIKIYLEDELLYEKSFGSSILEPYASMWHFLTLPRHIDGQTLRVELTSPYQEMSGQINEVFYGTHAMHYQYLFKTYGIRLLMGLLVLVIGITVMVSHFFFAQKQDRGFAYAGLFAVLLSLWMIAESRMLQFFTGSELLLGSLAYLALPLFPIPFIRYLKEYILNQRKKLLNILLYAFVIDFFFIILMQITGVMDYFESVIITHVLLIIGILTTTTMLFIEVKRDHNEKAFRFIKAFLALVFLAMVEIINFASGDYQHTSLYLSFGLMVIMVFLMISYARYLIGRLKLSYEKEFYEKLAYIDHVTQGKNRLAFERDLEMILGDHERQMKLRLIMFDLDELKKINDAYGHVEGDHAIKKAFDMISSIFGDQGMCYRIGGDEFACLYENQDEQFFLEKKELLQKEVAQFEKETPYHFGLSLGSSTYQSDMDQKALIKSADEKMYLDKHGFLQKIEKT
ncbi:MAG: hypothetical protein A2Y45_07930 [Tenericutes bacterium GWC2_34_14]|nr:MAG: hypothetical protein A2Z84_03190 [Tenericutes bacterium GWA2_35_7]OHE29827.1 MAG: hypothetical protein A2Y45_07930 [Tenericutes bacterium GWC2_34_14]OHE34806.1 MAG: hypothetical protein A2012_01540 [Tenericutes bacterium GWE2_34_108]OHE37333.1 MAG: hypothetical protein A2Y46_01470 [Tenericutes bacterium GWF1_35_14]OHE39534.1 MAG: hypothetical protein A2Y44_01390 [Tenericutes bacterium GWF2_35_184]OHE44277.1 MAG: hypothetical protein A2221_04120 [Tenericutes bacterium RIFOXYA2_FULL_36_3